MAAGLGRVVGLIGALALVAACSSGSSDATTSSPSVASTPVSTASTTTTTAATTSSTTTTTAAVTTTTVDPDFLLPSPIEDPESLTALDAPPPEVNLVAETWPEFLLVWEQIDAYWTWLSAHPTDDPAVLGVIFHPDGPEFAGQLEGFGRVVDAGVRLVGASKLGHILGFGCCQDPESELASGSITVNITSSSDDPSAVVLDSTDTVTEEIPGWDRRQFVLELRRTDSGEWLIWLFE